jgi:hypothetical protein
MRKMSITPDDSDECSLSRHIVIALAKGAAEQPRRRGSDVDFSPKHTTPGGRWFTLLGYSLSLSLQSNTDWASSILRMRVPSLPGRLFHRCNARRVVAAASSASYHPAGVSIDVYGVLLHLAQPVEEVYASAAERHGVRGLIRDGVKARWRAEFAAPRPAGTLRYEGDAREFWRRMVAASTTSSSESLFTELFDHYAKPEAWAVAPNAPACLRRLRAADMKLCVTSNFDTRLRRLLHDLELASLFDAIIVSAEVGAEKPSPKIFDAASAALGVPPRSMLHVGDDPDADVAGALAAGYGAAWLFGKRSTDGLTSFEELVRRLGV